MVFTGLAATADPSLQRTQTLHLHRGWNAIFIQVEPLQTDPALLFHQVPVDVVATYYPKVSPVRSVTNPADASWKDEGWGVWYAPSRANAFLSDLHAVFGHRAYLVHATQDYQWQLRGAVTLRRMQWQTDSFTLLGFPVDQDSPPTFGSFFAGSPAHAGQRIYRLVGGVWTPVLQPATTRMRDGEACWIYTQGASDYQGPIHLGPNSPEVFELSSLAAAVHLTVHNARPGTLAIQVKSSPAEVALDYQIRDLTRLVADFHELPSLLSLPPILPSGRVTLELRRSHPAPSPNSSGILVQLSERDGAQLWVPIGVSNDPTAGSNP